MMLYEYRKGCDINSAELKITMAVFLVLIAKALLHNHHSTPHVLEKEQEGYYLDRKSVGDNAVDCVLCERVKVFVRPSHELGFQPVPAAAIVLIHEEIQLCGKVWNR